MFAITFILLTVECVHSLVLSLRDSHVCYYIYITYSGMCSFVGSFTERLACLLWHLYYLQWNVFIRWFFHWETRMFVMTFILLTMECVHSLVRYIVLGYSVPE